MKALRSTSIILLLLLTLLVIQPLRSVQAQGALSAMCSGINNAGYGPVAGNHTFFGASFNPGEVVTVSHTGTAPFATVEAPTGTVVGTVAQGSTASFVIPTAADSFTIRNTFGGELTIAGTIKCGLPSASGSEVKFFDPSDDRLNRDPGQPAALYCRNKGDVHIYAVNPDDSKGKLALIVTKAEIDAVINTNPTANTLIKQSADGKFKLFYLPAAKELSFVTTEARSGKPYSFVWKGLCR